MHGIIRGIIPTVLCLSLGLGTSAVFAKSECKGKSKSACSTDASCLWVKGYVTKNGNKVDPYCRVKAKKKKAGDKSDAKQQGKKPDKAKDADKGKKVKEKQQTKKQENKS